LQQEVLEKAVNALKKGGVIAYPTEGVYGLGCDPNDEKAVRKILQIKQRPASKGLILLASDWSQLQTWLRPIPKANLEKMLATWPGPVTWVCPAKEDVPICLKGDHDSLAVRVTDHVLARTLCQMFAKPLVSTSANLSGQAPPQAMADFDEKVAQQIDYLVPGSVGDLKGSTPICDVLTGQCLRAG